VCVFPTQVVISQKRLLALRISYTLQRIDYEWFSTIGDTLRNRANDIDIGVYFPRSGHFHDPAGYKFEYAEIYVGTMADILSNPNARDITAYPRDYDAACRASTK